jgi:phospholipase/carboxylesterase
MIRALASGRRAPASGGTAKTAVVFVHGYGADGNDLLGLADPLGPHLPDTAFFAPNAPEKCSANPFGYQWFPIPWLDGSSEEQALAGLAAAADDLNAYLDGLLTEEGLTPDRLALVGFSQGTMMSLHVAPRRAAPIAGVVGFSGRLMQPELLEAATLSKPPVLLVHGDQDEVVPLASLPQAADALTAAGFETYSHISKGTGHGIAHDGLSLALSFLREKLPK